MWLWISTVLAADVAVLPLAKGSASEVYEGLGTALAGMIVSDLSVAGVDLVERQQLDAVLAEIDLSQTAYVDPEQAVKTGRLVGADLVAVGTWSVVGQTFVMDVRLIDTETSTVRVARSSSGTVEDFVAVEKDVLQALVEAMDLGLDAKTRRELMVSTPTEHWEALQAYSAGLAKEAAGEIEEARAAFSRATQIDPTFQAASAALASSAAVVQAEEKAHESAVVDAVDEAAQRVLASTSDLDASKATKDHGAAVARLVALRMSQQHCDFLEQAVAYGGRLGWRFPERASERALEILGEAGVFTGRPPHELQSEVGRYRWVSDMLSPEVLGDSAGRCLEPAEELALWDSIAAELGPAGSDPWQRENELTLKDQIELAWIHRHAQLLGPTEAWSKRMEAFVAGGESGSEAQKVRVELGRSAQKAAMARRNSTLLRGGVTVEQILSISRDILAPTPSEIDMSDPLCSAMVARSKGAASHGLDRYARQERLRESIVNTLTPKVRTLLDLGCVRGTPARFDPPEQAFGFVSQALDHPSPGRDEAICVGGEALRTMVTPEMVANTKKSELVRTQMILGLIEGYYGTQSHGCFDVRP